MADFAAIHPLGDLDQLQGDGGEGISLTVVHGFQSAQVFAVSGKESALANKLKLGTTPGVATDSRTMTALPVSPGQWMVFSKKQDGAFVSMLAKKSNGLGHVSEQSDSRICVRVSGPQARELMSRGCRLDLHKSKAGKGFCAQTPTAQVGVLLHQVDDAAVYDLYVYSGFARSFWHWITHTAEQFGYRVNSLRL